MYKCGQFFVKSIDKDFLDSDDNDLNNAITDNRTADSTTCHPSFPIHVSIPLVSISTLQRLYDSLQPWSDNPPRGDWDSYELFDRNYFTRTPQGGAAHVPSQASHSRCNWSISSA